LVRELTQMSAPDEGPSPIALKSYWQFEREGVIIDTIFYEII